MCCLEGRQLANPKNVGCGRRHSAVEAHLSVQILAHNCKLELGELLDDTLLVVACHRPREQKSL